MNKSHARLSNNCPVVVLFYSLYVEGFFGVLLGGRSESEKKNSTQMPTRFYARSVKTRAKIASIRTVKNNSIC